MSCNIYISIIVFILGLAIGSFINALVYRLHEKKSLFTRSACPKCGAKIYWFDNIPILSFILLHRRCRQCQAKISWQYPLVEMSTAILFLFVFLKTFQQFSIFNLQFSILIIKNFLIIFTGLFVFLYDLKYLEVEDKVVLLVSILILMLNFFSGEPFGGIILAIIIGMGFFALQYFLTHGKGVGLGDLRLGFFMAASLSWPKILVSLFLAYFIGAVTAIILLLLHKKKLKDPVPLGPFLVIGTFLALFYGEQIVEIFKFKISYF